MRSRSEGWLSTFTLPCVDRARMRRVSPLGSLRPTLIGNVRGVANDPATLSAVFPANDFHTRDQSIP